MTVSGSSFDDTLFQALIDAAVDGIITMNVHGFIMLFNPGAEKLFGYQANEVIGKNVSILMPHSHGHRHDGYVANYLSTGHAKIIGIGREVRALAKSGDEFPVDLSIGEAKVDGEHFFIGILRDLSRRTDLETQLRIKRRRISGLEKSLEHVHRTGTLGEMAAGIAHEINQPLSAIKTYANAALRLLEQGPEKAHKIEHALTQIGAQAQRSSDVIENMRNLARRQDAPRKPQTLQRVISDVLDLLRLEARETDAPIRVRLDEPLPSVEIDAVQIQQVILNLVRNALEALVTHSQAQKGISISAGSRGQGVRVSVADHGVGVDPNRLEDIFHPFETTKPTGMGIGLSICATIVKRHGGELWHEENPGGGSIFIFTLPVT